MRLSLFTEPELEFGLGGTHIDMRFGITHFGPLDREEATAPRDLRVGVVGTQDGITALRAWLERCRGEVERKNSKLTNLFVAFPGFNDSVGFRSSLVFHERWCSTIRQREIDAVVSQGSGDESVTHAVDVFLSHARDLIEQGGPMVLLCAPPYDLLAAVDERGRRGGALDVQEQELDESSEPAKDQAPFRAFHDVLKARAMGLSIPIQMVRPRTYLVEPSKKGKQKSPVRPMQDEATRAWNIHAALYYKASGAPWRLTRSASDLSTCFVGVSFYRSLEGGRLLTSVAQVFNERGEGVIVKGGQAKLHKDDKTPYLDEADAHTLLKNAVQVYRREHRTSPARIVVHKTARVTPEETAGFDRAAEEHEIDVVELLTVRKSFTRLYRESTYPPLRGTFIELQKASGLLYLKGSVDFFASYPGMYVPRPLELTVHRAETDIEQLAREIFALSKLNWNNTQFDGGEPITVRAARRVGDILKCVPEGADVQPTFRFFI